MNSYMLFHPENTAQEIQFRSRSRDDSSVFAPYDASSLMHYRSMVSKIKLQLAMNGKSSFMSPVRTAKIKEFSLYTPIV